jgi:hypothetical protein
MGLSCFGTEHVVAKQPNSTWVGSGGIYGLISCPAGFLLVNASIIEQECIECGPSTYGVDFMGGCKGEPPVCTAGRSCNKCPKGAECPGRSEFTALVSGSLWMPIYDFSSHTTYQRLVECPAGYTLTFDRYSPDQDRCEPCPYGSYGLEKPSNSSSDFSCLKCPIGANCLWMDLLEAKEGYFLIHPVAETEVNKSIVSVKVYRCPPGACSE